MLRRLSIRNYALIDRIDLEINPGLTAITGETGSGKSIMMDALALVLGERAESGILKRPEVKCTVEAVFESAAPDLLSLLDRNDLDGGSELILRREITPQGKSRAFVNDTPVRLETMREVGNLLVDIHGQNQNVLLGSETFRFEVLDAIAGLGPDLKEYRSRLAAYLKQDKEVRDARDSYLRSKAEEEFVRFQLEELESMVLEDVEPEELKNKLQVMEHAEEILRTLGSAVSALEDEQGIVPMLKSLVSSLERVGRNDSRIAPRANRLRQNLIDLADIAEELQSLADQTATDPAEAEEIGQLLDRFHSLLSKHRVSDVSELIALRELFRSKVFHLDGGVEHLRELEARAEALKAETANSAKRLSEGRRKALPLLEKGVLEMLRRVGMENARFAVQLTDSEGFGPQGTNELEFGFAANPGAALQPAHRTASGGETGRLMLCLRAITSRHRHIPTLILDEADTGTGGEIARKIGLLLAEIGKSSQLIAITHLPQIAARAEHHLKVRKVSDAEETKVEVVPLNQSARVNELAEMLSGKELTEAALTTAEELLRG